MSISISQIKSLKYNKRLGLPKKLCISAHFENLQLKTSAPVKLKKINLIKTEELVIKHTRMKVNYYTPLNSRVRVTVLQDAKHFII